MELIDKSEVVAEIKSLMCTTFTNFDEGVNAAAKTLLEFIDTLEVKEVDLEKEEDKLDKVIKLADAMYNAAQRLTTDASRLHKAMQDWWNFKNINL